MKKLRCVAHLKQVLVGNNPNKIVKTIQQQEANNVKQQPQNVKQNSIEIDDFSEEFI